MLLPIWIHRIQKNTAVNISLIQLSRNMVKRVFGKLYPIALNDYPKLLRYKVSETGIHYIEDLMREIYVEKRKLSKNKLTQLGLLLKTYVCQTKRIEDEILFQQISNKAKKYGVAERGFIIQCIDRLIMRGLLGSNPTYDPQIAIEMHRSKNNTKAS